MDPPDYRAFVYDLYSRRHEGVAPLRAAAELGDWRPKLHDCYRNCEFWVSRSPHHAVVYGFIVFDWLAELGFVRFQAHAVIQNETGELVDITPHEAEFYWPIIRHVGTLERYDEFCHQTDMLGVDLYPRQGTIRQAVPLV